MQKAHNNIWRCRDRVLSSNNLAAVAYDDCRLAVDATGALRSVTEGVRVAVFYSCYLFCVDPGAG